MRVETTSSSDKKVSSESLLAALTCPEVADSDHHLWWNNGTLWVAFSVLYNGCRQERIRKSLGTSDLLVARRLRDTVLREWARNPEVELSLRVSTRGVGRRRHRPLVATSASTAGDDVDAHGE